MVQEEHLQMEEVRKRVNVVQQQHSIERTIREKTKVLQKVIGNYEINLEINFIVREVNQEII